MKTLREVKIGETVKVVKLHGEGPVKRRIMDMGITKGTEVFVRKVAPWATRWKSPCAATSCRCVRRTPK